MPHSDELLGLSIAAAQQAMAGALSPAPLLSADPHAYTLSDGTVALPSLSFVNDLDCGLYRIGANNLGISVNAAKVLDIATTGLGVFGLLSASGTSAANGVVLTLNNSGSTGCGLSFIQAGVDSFDIRMLPGSQDLGFYSSSSNLRMQITSSGNIQLKAPSAGDTLTVAPSFSTGSLMATSAALTNNAGASVGTLTNAPAAGNPTKWIKLNDNGTIRSIPAW